MEINGQSYPDAGTTRQFVPDPNAGWVYEIVTAVTIIQHRADEIDQKIAAAQQAVEQAQAELAELTTQSSAIRTTMAKFITTPGSVSVDPSPVV